DFGHVRADQPRAQLPPARERAELEIVRNALRVRAQGGPPLERANAPRRQRTGRRMIEKDRLASGGPGELLLAQRLNVEAHGCAGTLASAPGIETRTVRGSSASRNASPSRLNPSTAAPIASPGNTDVHGACRS